MSRVAFLYTISNLRQFSVQCFPFTRKMATVLYFLINRTGSVQFLMLATFALQTYFGKSNLFSQPRFCFDTLVLLFAKTAVTILQTCKPCFKPEPLSCEPTALIPTHRGFIVLRPLHITCWWSSTVSFGLYFSL